MTGVIWGERDVRAGRLYTLCDQRCDEQIRGESGRQVQDTLAVALVVGVGAASNRSEPASVIAGHLVTLEAVRPCAAFEAWRH